MPVFHTKTIEAILEPVAQQVSPIMCKKTASCLMFTSDDRFVYSVQYTNHVA